MQCVSVCACTTDIDGNKTSWLRPRVCLFVFIDYTCVLVSEFENTFSLSIKRLLEYVVVAHLDPRVYGE